MIRKFGAVGGIASQPPGLNVGMGAGTAQPGDVLAPMTATNDNGEFVGALALTGDAVAANVLAGKKFYKDDAKTQLTGAMVNRAGAEVNARASNVATSGKLGFYPQSDGFFDTNSMVSYSDSSFIAANIPLGMALFGLAGTGGNVRRWQSGVLSTTELTPGVFVIMSLGYLTFEPKIIIVARKNGTAAEYPMGFYLAPGIFGAAAVQMSYYSGSVYTDRFTVNTDFVFRSPIASTGIDYYYIAIGP